MNQSGSCGRGSTGSDGYGSVGDVGDVAGSVTSSAGGSVEAGSSPGFASTGKTGSISAAASRITVVVFRSLCLMADLPFNNIKYYSFP